MNNIKSVEIKEYLENYNTLTILPGFASWTGHFVNYTQASVHRTGSGRTCLVLASFHSIVWIIERQRHHNNNNWGCYWIFLLFQKWQWCFGLTIRPVRTILWPHLVNGLAPFHMCLACWCTATNTNTPQQLPPRFETEAGNHFWQNNK